MSYQSETEFKLEGISRRYNFDLEESPEKRWAPMFEKNASKVKIIHDEIESLLKKMGVGYFTLLSVKALLVVYEKLGWISYLEEIKALGKLFNLSIEKMILMQLIYEQNSMCTSIITKVENKRVHYRTMDWDMPILKELTVELNVMKGKRKIGTVVTFMGYIGFLTLTSEKGFSLSINYRRSDGSLARNIARTLGMSWPIGYAIRHIFEAELSYEKTYDFLAGASLIAPCYITMCDSKDSTTSPMIMVRDCDKVSLLYVNPFTVQTNIDPFEKDKKKDCLYSFARRELATKIINDNGNNFKDADDIIKKLSVPPIINEETVHVCILNPENGEIVTFTPKKAK